MRRFPPTAFCHTCKIIRKTDTGTVDHNGFPIVSTSEIQFKCRFYNQKRQTFVFDGNVPFFSAETNIFAPADVDFVVGDYLSTTDPGWEGAYEIKEIRVRMGYNEKNHIQLIVEKTISAPP